MSSHSQFNESLRALSSLQEEYFHHTITRPVDHSKDLNGKERYLLSLSKIIAGDDTCAAIYETVDEGLLISNNTGNATRYEKVVSILKNNEDNTNKFGELLSYTREALLRG